MRGGGPRLCCALLVGLLACAPIAAQAQAAPGSNRYSGKTAQKFKISIASAKGQIQLVRFKIRLRCRDGSLLFDDLSDFEPAHLRQGGRFSDLQVGPTDEVIWRGRVHAAKVTGKLRVRDKLKNGVPCDSGSVGFAASGLEGRK